MDIRAALRRLNDNRAEGEDEIPAEIMKSKNIIIVT